MASNTATVAGDGVKVKQKPVDKTWLERCNAACQMRNHTPQMIEKVDVVLKADDLHGERGQVYRKMGLGFTDDMTVKVELNSFCGPGTHWDSKKKRCVVDSVPRSLCGVGVTWDDNKGQCTRQVNCTADFKFGGDICVAAGPPAPNSAGNTTALEENRAVVAGDGLEIKQVLGPNWLQTCFPVCELPKPQTLQDVDRTLHANDIDGERGLVYRKEGLGLTANINVKLNLDSFCGDSVHWNARLKRCVPNRVPSTLCGEGARWDENRGQFVRDTGCQDGFEFGGEVCVPSTLNSLAANVSHSLAGNASWHHTTP